MSGAGVFMSAYPDPTEPRPAEAAAGTIYRLTFLLPTNIAHQVATGRHCPCLHGCLVTIERPGRVTVIGPSRERVFDQAARFLRIVARRRGPMSIAALLFTPCSTASDRGATDAWSIIVGAQVAFSPTALDPDLDPGLPTRPPPHPPPDRQLELLEGFDVGQAGRGDVSGSGQQKRTRHRPAGVEPFRRPGSARR